MGVGYTIYQILVDSNVQASVLIHVFGGVCLIDGWLEFFHIH